MQKIQKFISVAVLASETSHVFCCVLPVLFSALSLLVGLGVIGAIPAGILAFHDFMHGWELPIIIASGVVILFGWWLHDYAKRLDCHDTGCGHGPCEPKKQRSAKILKIATVLFIVNVSVYFFVHRVAGINPDTGSSAVQNEVHDDHTGHDH